MPSTCAFEFDRPNPIYYGGETIKARLRLNTETEKTCREIYIEFVGKAKVRWSERRTHHTRKRTHTHYVTFRAKETYVNSRVRVHGEGKLAPGTYVYTFNITLPMQVPSSCVEKYGKIFYELILGIERPKRFNNVFGHPVTVLQSLNLNLSPEYLLPLHAEDIKYGCCWSPSSGACVSTLIIPYGGYAPGQSINFSLQVDNQSHRNDVRDIKIRLVQTYEFTSSSPRTKTRSRSITLAESIPNETILRLTKRILEGSLYIPPVPPTTKGACIIKVNYAIELYVGTGSCDYGRDICMPITIGTVPLLQTATNRNMVTLTPSNQNMVTLTTSNLPIANANDNSPPDYSLIAPPSYESATTVKECFVDEDIDAHCRAEDFLPKYPMYTNFTLPTAPPIPSNSDELPTTSTDVERKQKSSSDETEEKADSV